RERHFRDVGQGQLLEMGNAAQELPGAAHKFGCRTRAHDGTLMGLGIQHAPGHNSGLDFCST
ncbi:MAG TPA: hypothetical protein DHV03_05895, partial [Alphaproteobacteria bacterium]|nr:hypothetical protein [Alphaproteobacteria bacterium]